MTASLAPETDFVEYGIQYRDAEPRRNSWTPDYDKAIADCAFRVELHGDRLGPIRLVQRTVRVFATEWVDAVYPELNPLVDVDLTVNTVAVLPAESGL